MKTITFYNKKGGVGKTSFNIMYASYLAYKHGLKVAVADFDIRLQAFRTAEIYKMKGEYDPARNDSLWKIFTVREKDVRGKYGTSIDNDSYAEYLKHHIHEGELKDMDVVIFDFPGTFTRMHAQMYIHGLINLTIIPIDKDQQSLIASRQVIKMLEEIKCDYYGAFINQIQTFNKKEEYDELKKGLIKNNIKILPDMISYSERMKKIEDETTVNVMRSTLSYPNWEDKAFEGSKDLGIENLFRDVTILLGRTKDIPGTEPTELSFVKSIEKNNSVGSLNRQLIDSSFPELEMELPENMRKSFVKNR